MAALQNTPCEGVVERYFAKLLAPLPDSAEPADSSPFRAALAREAREAWTRAMRRYWIANHLRNYFGLVAAVATDEDRDERAARSARAGEGTAVAQMWEATDRLMRLPAPGLVALKWKREHRSFRKGHPDWEAAIARDEERLGA